MPTTFAYMRVSTDRLQTTDNQRKLIVDGGFVVHEWYSEDGVSGSIEALKRPQFAAMMQRLVKGDTCIVTMLDRLGRNAEDILHTMNQFQKLGVKLRIIQFDGIDVCSPMGKLVVSVMAAVAEMERNLISERTILGLARTKEQGTVLGPPLTIKPNVLSQLCERKGEGASFDTLVVEFGIAKNTIVRNIKKWGDNLQGYAQEYCARECQYALALAK